jgi:hypothetical protein
VTVHIHEVRGLAVPSEAWAARSMPAETRDLTSLDYLRFVHPRGSHGLVRLAARLGLGEGPTKKYVFRERRCSPTRIREGHQAVICALKELSFHTFATYPYGKPGKDAPKATDANITSICANWIDLDYYGVQGLRGMSKGDVLDVVLRICGERRWPAPSYVLSSGRGLLVVWLYEPAPNEVLPRWRTVQRTLNRAFKELGHDASGLSPGHVYRFVGSYNPSARNRAFMLWPFYVADIHRGSFDELARAVVPHTRRAAKALAKEKLERAAKRAAETVEKARARREMQPAPATVPAADAAPGNEPAMAKRARVGGIVTGTSYWGAIRTDLEKLFAHRHPGGVMTEGDGRSTVALCFTYVEAWLRPASELEDYVRDNATRWGFSEAEALSCTSGVRAEARRAAKGEKKTWMGRKVDPRYRPGPARLIELLHIRGFEMEQANLRILVDDERRKAVVASRQEALRRGRGAKARVGQQAARLTLGMEALRLRREEGLKRADLAARLGVEPRYLDTCLRDAKAVDAIGKVSAKPVKKRRASHETSRGTSRAKVGKDVGEVELAL